MQSIFQIERIQDVYWLNEENYDEFVNWNPYAFICFYDSTTDNKEGRMKRMLSELMVQVAEQSRKEDLPHVVGIFDFSQGARIIEARLQPIKSPDFRLFM